MPKTSPAVRYRHEWKHEINYADLLAVRMRMRAVAEPDPHAQDGRYLIRSLYFDTPEDKALREKLDGLDRREKFRIRCYNGDTSLIKLEKKCKLGGLCAKSAVQLSESETRRLLAGEIAWMAQDERALVQELYCKQLSQRLAPRTIVEYTREPFVYAPGNVRVTLDYNIRTGLGATELLEPGCLTVPAGDSPIILEVKWDEYLPSLIRDAVQLGGRREGSFSKYAQCRIYG